MRKDRNAYYAIPLRPRRPVVAGTTSTSSAEAPGSSNIVFVDFAKGAAVAASTVMRDGLDACYAAMGLPARAAEPAPSSWSNEPKVPASEEERRWRRYQARRQS